LITIALDAMGGDNAPKATVEGALLAIEEHEDLKIILIGNGDFIKETCAKKKSLEFVEAPDIISMDEAGAKAIKAKPDSSLVKGLKLVKEGKADGFLSAGNTGAIMSGAFIYLGRIKGVSRPAIAVIIPTSDKPIILLDAGANTDCKAEHLFQFAEMGSAFCSTVFHTERPSIGLLNIGEEKSKGDSIIKQAHDLIENSNLNFYGNVEGKDIALGTTNVVVCDGFTGNVVLKTMEGVAGVLFKELKNVINSATLNKVGGFLLSKPLKRLHSRLNQDTYGGAYLLGVNGVCVISHGSANKTAIKNAIKLAKETVENKMVEKLEEAI
jgi:glycerol-3-phosphate acyltransferase PlsX